MTGRRKSGDLLRQTAVHPLGRLTLGGFLIDYRSAGPMAMRFWNTYGLVYVLAGRARLHDETGLSLPLRPGDLLLIFPGHGYHYDIDPRQPWSEFALHFQGPAFDLWRQQRVVDPAKPVYHLMPIDRWSDRFEELIRSRPTRRAGHVLRQVCQLQAILADVLAEGCRRKGPHPQNLWLSQATALLDKQPVAERVDWQAVSDEMGLSYSRFRKRFVQAVGTPPAKYLMARRLEVACKLLEDRKLGLKEIARACGFCDAFQFSKQFKSGLRLTPTEYRQRKLHGP
jgi:AraC-like DNA-binding protein